MLRIILQVTERQGHFMKKYVMALDQGTTSSRCILFDREGQICSMAQKEFEQSYPKPGWVEQKPPLSVIKRPVSPYTPPLYGSAAGRRP